MVIFTTIPLSRTELNKEESWSGSRIRKLLNQFDCVRFV